MMRVLSLAPSNTEIVYKLGCEDKLIGTTSLCNYPEEALEKPSIGGWSKGVKTGKIKELNPDLILCSDSLQDKVSHRLRGEGFEILQVKPQTLEQVYNSIRRIGNALNKDLEAEKVVQEMKNEINSISINQEKIYCEEWLEPPHFSGNWVPGLIEKINGRYFVKEGVRSSKFDFQKLEEFNPDHIFLSICGAGENISRDEIFQRDGWSSLDAVRNNEVYVMDDSLLNRPTPRLVEAAKQIEKNVKN